MSKKLKKILIGIRSQQRLFRVLGMGGDIVDSLLDMRGAKGIDEDYFEQISISRDKEAYEVFNEEKGNSCKITLDSIIITKKAVGDDSIDIKKFRKDVILFYEKIREILRIREINRVGIIFEFETPAGDTKNVNKFLYDNFLDYTHDGIPSNFTLKTAFKTPTKEGWTNPEDVKDYYNAIVQFGVKYGEERTPIEDLLFISLDVQRYFHPPTKAKNGNLIGNHFDHSERHLNKFIEQMKEKGLDLD
ncbi:MAG: hypothetical protein JRL30_09675 [Deltaproteobacteria bacterium]|nr:hypothetical protein [Deltaproteobacteria bacterium]